jgi:hypothetical protein
MVQKYIKTNEMALAASLTAFDVKLIEIDKSDPEWVAFCFEYTRVSSRLIHDYQNSQLHISPQVLLDSIDQLEEWAEQ